MTAPTPVDVQRDLVLTPYMARLSSRAAVPLASVRTMVAEKFAEALELLAEAHDSIFGGIIAAPA